VKARTYISYSFFFGIFFTKNSLFLFVLYFLHLYTYAYHDLADSFFFSDVRLRRKLRETLKNCEKRSKSNTSRRITRRPVNTNSLLLFLSFCKFFKTSRTNSLAHQLDLKIFFFFQFLFFLF
jgi:hypothetical protein